MGVEAPTVDEEKQFLREKFESLQEAGFDGGEAGTFTCPESDSNTSFLECVVLIVHVFFVDHVICNGERITLTKPHH